MFNESPATLPVPTFSEPPLMVRLPLIVWLNPPPRPRFKLPCETVKLSKVAAPKEASAARVEGELYSKLAYVRPLNEGDTDWNLYKLPVWKTTTEFG